MTVMGIDDLRRILTECAGADEQAGLDGDIADVPFEDLGYDSLALMEMTARIGREFGVAVRDEQIADLPTPRAVLDAVNAARAE